MRGVLSAVLVGVGVFLIVLAAMFRFWAPDRAEKTPLNLDLTTVATGPATFSAGGGQTSSTQLQATRHVRVDSTASDADVVVVVESLCIVKLIDNPPSCVSASDSKNRLVSLTTDRVAADRRTAESVNDPKYGEYVNSDTNVRHKGLSYKWPFDAQKKSYAFFDPNSGQAPDAKYVRTESAGGIDCYVYEATEKGLDVDVAPGVPGKYDDTRTVWIDPVTGTIVKGVEHQIRTLSTGEVALETTLTFNDATIKLQAGKADDGRTQIDVLTKWVPLAALVLGLAAIVGGVLLSRSKGRSGGLHREKSAAPPPPTYAGTSQT